MAEPESREPDNPYASSSRSKAQDPNSAASSGPDGVSAISRNRLLGECLGLGVVVSIGVSIVSTYAWDIQERAEGSIEKFNWSPWDDLASVICFMPFGFLLLSFTVAGALYWFGLAATLWSRRRFFIVFVLAGAIWFGIIWPQQCVAMLGI